MIDRYHLRYFLAVVDYGNFSRAAEACRVAQPTLSVGVAKLEQQLDCRLFVRSNQRVVLTDAGTRFLPHARRIEREFTTALRAMEGVIDRTSLRLGVINSLPGELVAAGLKQVAPIDDYDFELVFGSERELTANLTKGRIDLAIMLLAQGTERFPQRALFTEGYSLAIAATHPLAGRSEIPAEELAGETMIVRRHCEALSETSRFFTERGVRPHFALRSTNDERVLEMVAAGLGITIMPDCYAHDAVARPRLSGFTIERTLGLVASPGTEHLLTAPPTPIAAVLRSLESAAP